MSYKNKGFCSFSFSASSRFGRIRLRGMPTCVYCYSTRHEKFAREHVIPQSFGSFQHSLTLGCVCGDCNRYFGKQLELGFARESAESIVRYRHGLRDMESASRTNKVRAKINVPGPMLGAKVLLRPNALRNGIDIVYLPQVAFKINDADDWKWYTEEDLTSEVLRPLQAGSTMKLLVSSRAEEEKIRSRLRELGLGHTKEISRDEVPPRPDIKTRVTCDFDSNMSRCVAKIAFNYFAYVLQENTRLLLRREFDTVRNYVRNELNPEQPIVYFSERPKLEPDSNTPAFVDGHILAVGWDTTNENIGCALSLFNAMTYRVALCRKYEGLWFALQSAHSFDFETGRVKRIPLNLLGMPIL
jgi:hypothetical protein